MNMSSAAASPTPATVLADVAGRAILSVSCWSGRAIYLPRSVRSRSKSEEGRRILPAVTMLETGNYIVPQVGSEPYLRKPPLVNWLVAGSFKLFGARNEWTARLPSVLCVLAVALAFVRVARRSLGPNGAIAAALMWLTNFGLLEKGRMIEIEALYVSLTALAFICWLSWWKERAWLAWTVPWIFLGLGAARQRSACISSSFTRSSSRSCGRRRRVAAALQRGRISSAIVLMLGDFRRVGHPLPANG